MIQSNKPTLKAYFLWMLWTSIKAERILRYKIVTNLNFVLNIYNLMSSLRLYLVLLWIFLVYTLFWLVVDIIANIKIKALIYFVLFILTEQQLIIVYNMYFITYKIKLFTSMAN